ncbi:zinc finger, CCHC-type containing protein [Tanacetum coccineum]
MGNANPIRTLGDYSKPSHEGYRNTIELPEENNVVPLRSDTIRNWLERLPAGSITTWEDLTTRFLAQFFPPIRTAKLRNDILMFQQHQGETISEVWTRFKDLSQKVPHHGIDRWLLIQMFYDHNLALYDHERWNVSKVFVKLVKAISTSQGTSKTPDRRLLDLEDQINFLIKGPRPTSTPSSTHVPQPYVKAVSLTPHPRNQSEPPKQNPFTFYERTSPYPQPQALETTFEARVRDYMAAHAKRLERFENAIFKQREVINDIITEMFRLLKELSASRTSKKVLIKEEARHPITKSINSISVIRVEEEKNCVNNRAIIESIVEPRKSEEKEPPKKASVANEVERRADDEPTKSVRENVTKNEEEEPAGVSSCHTVGYYLKHKINEKLIEGLVDNQKFNDSLSVAQVIFDEKKLGSS